ncbi:MAG: glycosyl hydrolase 53 family protein [Butyrivibrio sp.]|nr:glycosyl hydrolase 53 family protein [Butyrivibrio sp.]
MEYIKGADVSSLLEVERVGGRFYDGGRERELYDILADYGINYIRLRLWNDPYAPDGRAYGGGTNDLPAVTELALRAKKHGMKVLLDYHYSDFWADPGKQTLPKAWRGKSVDELEKAVYDYTSDTLEALGRAGAAPDMIQIGNEMTNGLMWPCGRVPEYDNIARFVGAGIRAARKVCPRARIMLHLDNGGRNDLYRGWFDNYTARGEDFDIIGLSYYPFWHGTMEALKSNMDDIAVRYGKDLVIAEVSMGYTMEDYASYEGLPPDKRKGMATKPKLVAEIEHSMTVEGQCDFLRDLFKIIDEVPNGRGRGFFYWEPAWIPVKGCEWATPAALEYTGEKGPGGNEWANQALFDYEGNALPSLRVIKDLKE